MANWTKEEQAEHRRLWVEALRSGDYEQSCSALAVYENEYQNVPYKFCCLGVACDISGLGVWEIDSFPGNYVIENLKEQSDTYLLPAVQDWLGLATENAKFNPDPEIVENINDGVVSEYTKYLSCSNLADLNDLGCGFTTIAKIIEHAEELDMLKN